MGGTNSIRNPQQLEIDYFGKKELVDFKMNLFLITEDKTIKNFFKKLTDPQNEQNENYDLNRDIPLTHVNYKGWKYFYYEKKENENIKELLNKTFNKISEWKNDNNIPFGNTFIIYLQNFENNNLLNYLECFIEKEFSEGEQPFIVFLINREENEINAKKKELREILKEAAQNFIKRKYKNKEIEERLNNLVIEEYYLPYNIFLIPYNKNNKRNLNNNDNNRINNIDENNQIIDKNDNNSIKNYNNNNNIINDYNNIINNDNNNIINNNIINNINDDNIIIPNNDNINNKNIALINNYLLKFASCYNEIGDYFSIDESNELSYNFLKFYALEELGQVKVHL